MPGIRRQDGCWGLSFGFGARQAHRLGVEDLIRPPAQGEQERIKSDRRWSLRRSSRITPRSRSVGSRVAASTVRALPLLSTRHGLSRERQLHGCQMPARTGGHLRQAYSAPAISRMLGWTEETLKGLAFKRDVDTQHLGDRWLDLAHARSSTSGFVRSRHEPRLRIARSGPAGDYRTQWSRWRS